MPVRLRSVSSHTLLRADRKPLGLRLGEGRAGEHGGGNRLQRQRHAELLDHVGLVREVEVHLDGTGAIHHVEAARADQRHVAAHHRIAPLGHARRLGQRPVRRESDAEKADAERGAGGQALAQVLVRLGADLVHGAQRIAGQLELAAGLQRHRPAGLSLGPLEGDDVVALHDRQPAELRDQAFHQRPHAARTGVGNGLQGIDVEEELLVLGTDAPRARRLGAGSDPGDQVVARADGWAGRAVLAGGHGLFVVLIVEAGEPSLVRACLLLGKSRAGHKPCRRGRLAPIAERGVHEGESRHGRGIGPQDAWTE